jgi:hypothetical protein
LYYTIAIVFAFQLNKITKAKVVCIGPEYGKIEHNAIKQTSFGSQKSVRAIGQGKIVLRVCVSV